MAKNASIEEMRHGSVTAIEVTDAHGRRRTIDLGELNEADLALCEQFGYQPVFKRSFGYFSAFSFAVSISGLFSTVTTTFYYPLIAGGVSSAVWCWLIAGAGCMCIALSVAELVSAYPTSGGLYYTVSRLAPPPWVPSISWVVGWLNLLGQIAGVASSEYGAAQMLLACVSFSMPAYVPTIGHTIAVMAALTILCGIINSMSTYWMEKLTSSYVIIHVAVLVSCSIALLVMTPTEYRHDASYVFTYIPDETASGWTPKGWSFIFGFLSVAWTMTDYDGTAHICEEIENPELKAPWAISLAMAFTYIVGFLFNIVLAFCAGDPTDILNSPVQQPVAQIYYNSLGKTGGIVFTFFAFLIIQFVCWSALQALSRTVFAFSRDNLLPASKVWTVIWDKTGTPMNAIWLSTFLCIVINLIGLGSYAAISGVFNITSIALDNSYTIPILCKVLWPDRFKPGPWHLGKFSFFINLWAIVWTLFVSVIFILPTNIPVTALNMNYAIAFLAFILIVAMGWWMIRGKHVYTGPIAQGIEGVMDQNIPAAVLEKQEKGSDGNDSQEMDRKS